MSECINFEPKTTEFSLRNALCLARVAELSYKANHEVESTARGQWGMDRVVCFDEPSFGTQGFVMTNDAIVVAVFRGTEINRPEDVSTDLQFLSVRGPLGGRVHEGFYRALDLAWPAVEQAIALCWSPPKSLWFTGHSLGAALATLAVAKMRDRNQSVSGLYTFGQPRIGDRDFAKKFNDDFGKYTFRFVNNNDVVARIPPRELQYRHVGTLKYFTEDGRLLDKISLWKRFLDRVRGRMADFLEWGTDGLKDHAMPNYVALIEGAIRIRTGQGTN